MYRGNEKEEGERGSEGVKGVSEGGREVVRKWRIESRRRERIEGEGKEDRKITQKRLGK